MIVEHLRDFIEETMSLINGHIVYKTYTALPKNQRHELRSKIFGGWDRKMTAYFRMFVTQESGAPIGRKCSGVVILSFVARTRRIIPT